MGIRALAASTLLVAGCFHYGPFDCTPNDFFCRGGYSEVELMPDVYQVRFEGGSSQAQTEDLTLLRCAELALERGYAYFVMLETVDSRKTRTSWSPGTSTPTRTVCDSEGKNCTTVMGTSTSGSNYTHVVPGYALTVRLVSDPTPRGPIVYEAASVQRDLRRKYKLPAMLGIPD